MLGQHQSPFRCYVAASWRTPSQPEVVAALRAGGVSTWCAVFLAPNQEPELMLKVAEYFTDSLPALVDWARTLKGL